MNPTQKLRQTYINAARTSPLTLPGFGPNVEVVIDDLVGAQEEFSLVIEAVKLVDEVRARFLATQRELSDRKQLYDVCLPKLHLHLRSLRMRRTIIVLILT